MLSIRYVTAVGRDIFPTAEKKALRPLEQSAGRLCDNHKTSPNNEAHEETVHVEKSNYDVVSLGSNAFCF